MSVRLSPAASLLRNSKLFALPPQIALPAAPPSSDQVAHSDTATTIYPQFAAIQTTSISGASGDWGFKRPLPSKVTKNSSNPIIRLVRGIDTPEHVADFESAADHGLTLRKFQELHTSIRHEEQIGKAAGQAHDIRPLSVFRATHDNTTNLSSSAPSKAAATGIWPEIQQESLENALPSRLKEFQSRVDQLKKKQDTEAGVVATPRDSLIEPHNNRIKATYRWKYSGPSLLQMNGLEFDEYLNKLGENERKRLNERIQQQIKHEKLAAAREAGTVGDVSADKAVTAEEVQEYLRHLRQNPRQFGPILAELLDLPEAGIPRGTRLADTWEYGRRTLACSSWQVTGPPTTHPSAGLSYLTTERSADNHPKYGPQTRSRPVLARAVKERQTADSRGSKRDIDWGVAGFIVQDGSAAITRNRNRQQWRNSPGGQKMPVHVVPPSVSSDGALKMHYAEPHDDLYTVVDDEIVPAREVEEKMDRNAIDEARMKPRVAPRLSNIESNQMTGPSRSYRRPVEPSADIDVLLSKAGSRVVNRR